MSSQFCTIPSSIGSDNCSALRAAEASSPTITSCKILHQHPKTNVITGERKRGREDNAYEYSSNFHTSIVTHFQHEVANVFISTQHGTADHGRKDSPRKVVPGIACFDILHGNSFKYPGNNDALVRGKQTRENFVRPSRLGSPLGTRLMCRHPSRTEMELKQPREDAPPSRYRTPERPTYSPNCHHNVLFEVALPAAVARGLRGPMCHFIDSWCVE